MRNLRKSVICMFLLTCSACALATADPQTAMAKYREGREAEAAGKYSQAIGAYQASVAAGFPGPHAALGEVRVLAQGGDPEAATSRFSKMFTNGFTQVQMLEGDAVLLALAKAPALAGLYEAARIRRFPCEKAGPNRDLDFWIGEWDVESAGVRMGSNTIVRVAAGCALTETWRSAVGETGSSLNWFDATTGHWRQVYIGDAGDVSHYSGSLVGVSMVHYTPEGQFPRRRMTIAPMADGSVSQLIELQPTSGADWRKDFDATYRRSAATSHASN